ncbi:MAG TPA: hypothetical protein VGO93_27130 [Candidatus Xenobia bacterium]|jgi:hypothetical protein
MIIQQQGNQKGQGQPISGAQYTYEGQTRALNGPVQMAQGNSVTIKLPEPAGAADQWRLESINHKNEKTDASAEFSVGKPSYTSLNPGKMGGSQLKGFPIQAKPGSAGQYVMTFALAASDKSVPAETKQVMVNVCTAEPR